MAKNDPKNDLSLGGLLRDLRGDMVKVRARADGYDAKMLNSLTSATGAIIRGVRLQLEYYKLCKMEPKDLQRVLIGE